MRQGWLLIVLAILAACGGSPAVNPAPTQTRAAELAQLTAVVGTAAANTGTPTARATSTAQPGTATPAAPGPVRATPTPHAVAAPSRTVARRGPIKPGVPAFTDLVLDETHGRLYGSDQVGGRVVVLGLPGLETVTTIDVGQAAQPVALALSPDGAELAVALSGAGTIALIDTGALALVGKLYPKVENGPSRPWDVRYAPSGRLYSVGNPGSGGIDYVHVFDTATRSEVGRSQYPEMASGAPRLALAADGAIFVGESAFSPQQLYRFALDGDLPKRVAQGPHGPVIVPDLAVRRDGSAVYTAGGQVWSSNLQSQLGAFTAKGTRIEYAPATERLYVCQEAGVAEVEATGNYNVVAAYTVAARPRVARANAAGTAVYVSTDAGLEVIQPGTGGLVSPNATPAPTATLAPSVPTRPAGGATPTMGSRAGHTPTKPGVPAFFDLALDEDRGRLYGTDHAAGKLIVLALPTLDRVGTVDLGQASQPTGVALSPDGAEIAVALSGAGNIALVDPDRLVITGKLYPTVDAGGNQPWDVRYSPAGRLFSTGNPGSGGFDYIHVFDTKQGAEIGKSRDIVRAAPRLAFAADGSLFVAEPGFSPQQLFRYALDGDVPVQVARGPHGPVNGVDLAVRPDGAAVYTAGGQVWSGDLQRQLGAFTAKGTRIEYVPATERLYICQESAVVEVEATGNYNVVATYGVGAPARVARADARGTVLYVSTDAGLEVIPLGASSSPAPEPR